MKYPCQRLAVRHNISWPEFLEAARLSHHVILIHASPNTIKNKKKTPLFPFLKENSGACRYEDD
jgi:hypothetical protein